MNAPFQLHREALVGIAADSTAIFAWLDDHRRLSAHMEKRSLMMAGATMTTELDSQRGQAVGSVIRMKGVMLGVPLYVEEVVTQYEPPFSENLGNTRSAALAGDRPVPHGIRTLPGSHRYPLACLD